MWSVVNAQRSFDKLRKEMVEFKVTESPETHVAGSQRKNGWIEKLRNLNRIPRVPGHITSSSCSGWDFLRLDWNTNGGAMTGKRTVTGSWELDKCWSSHGWAGRPSSADGQRWAPIMGFVPYEKRKTPELPVSAMCTYSKKVAICKSERGPHQESNPLAPWSWTPQPPGLWEVNVCHLNYQVCGILLWRPELTNTSGPTFSAFPRALASLTVNLNVELLTFQS